jgi:hypothetical protein
VKAAPAKGISVKVATSSSDSSSEEEAKNPKTAPIKKVEPDSLALQQRPAFQDIGTDPAISKNFSDFSEGFLIILFIFAKCEPFFCQANFKLTSDIKDCFYREVFEMPPYKGLCQKMAHSNQNEPT